MVPMDPISVAVGKLLVKIIAIALGSLATTFCTWSKGYQLYYVSTIIHSNQALNA